MPSLFQQEILKLQSVQIVFNTCNASRRSSSDLAIRVWSFANKTLLTVSWFIRKLYLNLCCHCSVMLFMYWLKSVGENGHSSHFLIYFCQFSFFQNFHCLLELLYLSPRFVALLLLVKITSSVICMSAAYDWLVNADHSSAWCPQRQIQMDKKSPVCYGPWGFITYIKKPPNIEPAESISLLKSQLIQGHPIYS
jgi:hypothetical protein